MDILVPSLAGTLEIETSGRIFIFFIFVLTVCGAVLSTRPCTVASPSAPCSYFVYCTTGYLRGHL